MSSPRTGRSCSTGWTATPSRPRAASPIAAHAAEVADFFLDELLRNGTTTALVFGTVHAHSVDVFFERALARSLRMVAGKVLMDRNCPEALRDDPETRLPRVGRADREMAGARPAGLCDHAALCRDLLGRSARSLPASSRASIRRRTSTATSRRTCTSWRGCASCFRGAAATSTSTSASGCCASARCTRTASTSTSPTARAWRETRTAAAVCPTSNLFLGSGLFDFAAARAAGMRVGLGTDVGGGTSFSLLRTMSEAYKVAQLTGPAPVALACVLSRDPGRCARRWRWTIASATSSPARKPISWCCGSTRRRCSRGACGRPARPPRCCSR